MKKNSILVLIYILLGYVNISSSQQTKIQGVPSTNKDPNLISVDVFDDLISGSQSSSTIGTSGLLVSQFGTGTSSFAAGTQNNPGLLRLNSHATNDNSGIYLILANSGGASTTIATSTYSNTSWFYDGVVIFGSSGTAITNTSLNFGLTDGAANPASAINCIWIRHDSDLSDTTFVFAVGNASGAAGCNSAGDNTDVRTIASTITPSAGTAYRFRIRRAISGIGGNPTIYMNVNNETPLTFCSSGCNDTLANVPSSGNLMPVVVYTTRTTTGVMSSDVDYVRLQILGGLTRY